MNKNEAKKQIKKLREEINLHNYRYYVENNPVISDYEFDQLLKKLEPPGARPAESPGG